MPGGGGGRPSSAGWAAAICGSIIAAIAATVTAIVTALVVALAVRATRPVNERNLMGILLTLPAERFGAPFGLLLPAFPAGL
ncbi:hypothetical protein GCM10019059_29790 [Camelimonas fluminis]|nr:hypothetical protein GCM10019059_29790 [Camelimonas fluminis]